MRDGAGCSAADVRKPPREETALGERRAVRQLAATWARSAGGFPPATAHAQDGLQPPTESNVVAPELAAGAQLRPRRGWNWMGELGEKFVAPWAHWRREREIKTAVAALANYDERTLRDLGIHGRADIERMVRYCRDC